MRYNFNMVIGDYFGDGHGRTQSFHIGTDKPIKDVLEAQTQIIAKTGIDLHSFANKFEDDLLPADVVQQLKKLGYPRGAGCHLVVPAQLRGPGAELFPGADP